MEACIWIKIDDLRSCISWVLENKNLKLRIGMKPVRTKTTQRTYKDGYYDANLGARINVLEDIALLSQHTDALNDIKLQRAYFELSIDKTSGNV